MTEKLDKKGEQTQAALKELAGVKLVHRQKSQRVKKAGSEVHDSIKKIAAKQDQLLETQNEQGRIIEELQEHLVQDLEAKIACKLDSFNNQHQTPREAQRLGGRDYARATELPPSNSQASTDTVIPKYTAMNRRRDTTRRTSTHTDGQLVRLYV